MEFCKKVKVKCVKGEYKSAAGIKKFWKWVFWILRDVCLAKSGMPLEL
jgi:hypothetical protein